MIDVFRARIESRERDRRRMRIILSLGQLQFHLSRQEATLLHRRLGVLLGEMRGMGRKTERRVGQE